MPSFDPSQFLDATMDTPLQKRPPLPVNDYIGVLGEPTVRPWVSSKDPTKSGYAVDYPVEISVPADVADRLGLREPILRMKYGIMLDLTATGTIDQSPGANGALRRLREAVNMNKPGDSFSLRAVTGRTAKFRIGHREYPEGSGEMVDEITGITRA